MDETLNITLSLGGEGPHIIQKNQIASVNFLRNSHMVHKINPQDAHGEGYFIK